jgi:hypothetical protein
MGEPLTEDEKQTLKAAAFGAVYLVSNADQGFFSTLRESFAASGALAGASGLVGDLLTRGPLPKLPKSPPVDEAEVVLPALRRSVQILAAKLPEELETYRATVTDAVERVAAAVHGVTARESDMVAKIKTALAG